MSISKTAASRFLLALIICLFVTGISLAVYTLRSNPVEDILSSNRVINALFVIEDEKKPVSSYVLMYYQATKRAAIFDIPGELGLLITRINRVDRIDRVYDSNRIGSFEDEVEKLLGIEINFSIVITKDNLISMVDLLEGVQIFIPSPLSYRDDEKLLLFPYGMTVLDGDKAAEYAVYSLEDEEREMEVFRRQRFFLGLLDRWILMNEKMKNPQAAKLYFSFFKTSMNRRTFTRLYDEFVNIDTSRTHIRSVEGNLREVSGQALIIPHWDGSLVKEVVRQTLGALVREVDDLMNERTPTVEVLNGTAINGLAGRTAEMLRSLGYDVISISNADRNDFDRTLLVQRSGDESMLTSLAELLRCKNFRRELELHDDEGEEGGIQSVEYKADLTLTIGRDFNGRYVTGN